MLGNPFKFKSSVSKFGGRFKKFINLIVFSLLGILLIVILVEATDSENKSKSGDDYKYIEYIDRLESIHEYNEDGSVNGLNLLLIKKMTEGYCKDYLEIAEKNQKGEISPDCDYKTPVEKLLGVVSMEQGCYPNTSGYVLCSSLGINDDGTSIWNKDNKVTLYDVGSSSYDSGKVKPYMKGYKPGGNYVSPFQISSSYFGMSDTYKKSNLSSGDASSSRTSADMGFFPDQVSIVNWEYKYKMDAVKNATTSNLSNDALEMCISITYAGTPIMNDGFTPHSDPESLTQALNKLAEFCNKLKKNYSSVVNDPEYNESQLFKWIMIPAVVKEGGKISSETLGCFSNSYQKKGGELFMSHFKIDGSLDNLLSSNVDSSIPYQGNSTGEMSLTLGDYHYILTPESFFHYIGEIVNGPVMYARMLVMGGLKDVDPTNPSTYMNQLKKKGEWTPSGEADWLKDAGVDMTKLTEKRVSILNEGHTILGAPYVWGGVTWPVKSGDSWSGGLDCSSFVQQCIMRKLNIDISRTTYTQFDNSNLEEVSKENLQPGDLIYVFSAAGDNHHVVFFLSWNTDGSALVLHAPKTGDVVKVSNYYEANGHFEYRRVKGIDD